MSYPYGGAPSGPNPQQPYGPPSGPTPQPMPPYGQDPYAQPGYGAPQGYGQPGYAQPSVMLPPHVGVPAEWGTRLGGYLLDSLIVSGVQFVAMVAAFLVGGVVSVLGAVVESSAIVLAGAIAGWVLWGLGTLGFAFWIFVYRRGVYGQTLGQKIVRLKTVSEETGQVLGAGSAFGRQVCHFLDSLACCVGWFAPLWEPKKQTWADKILKSVVVSVDSGSPLPPTKKEQKEQQQGAAAGYPGLPQSGYPQQW